MAKSNANTVVADNGAEATVENTVPVITPATHAARPFKVKRSVTLPLFKFQEGVERYLHVDGAMYEAKPLKKLTPAQAAKKPPILMHVTDMLTGEEGQIIVNTVLADILKDEYPEEGYVGKSFAITRHPIDTSRDKNYATFSVMEIEED
jgi:hypothetical protein